MIKLHNASERSHVQNHDSTYSRICFCLGSLSIDQSQSFGAVQRKAAHYVCNDYTSRTPGCVTKMLSDLRWEPLEVRRRHDRLCMLYRIQHSLVDIPIERYLQVCDSRTRGPAKFFQERITDTTYTNSFFPRTVRDWNKFSSTVVSAASLDEFQITPLDVICSTTRPDWQQCI